MSILKLKDSQGNWVGVPTVKGDKGNGISSAVLNNDYTLTLTFTDGTTYTTPSIRGEKGEQGEPATDMDIHICSTSEYDSETRIPTIANPDDKTFYLVPTEDGTSPDLFTEWVYVNNAWEMFGSASIDLSGYLTDVQVNGTSVVTDGVANITNLKYVKDDPTDDGGVIEGHISANSASGAYAHSEGDGTTASAPCSHAEGYQTTASNTCSHAEGRETTADALYAHTEGYQTTVTSMCGHAEGTGNTVSGDSAHAEGNNTTASGRQAHSEGGSTTASGESSHAEGAGTRATGGQAHSEGGGTLASGNQAHAEGASTIASGDISHAEGLSTTASGACSHASGINTIAQRKSQMTIGEYNVADTGGSTTSDKGDYILIAGNGTTNSNRSNAMTLDWSGNEKLGGSLTLGMNTQDETTISASELKGLKEMSPVEDVQINSTSIVQDGVAEIPIASNNNLGVAKYNSSLGVTIVPQTGVVSLVNPTDSEIKNGTSSKGVLVTKQHESTFYGLAKAAGADEKDSTLAFGTYSDNAKSSIQNMLGITDKYTPKEWIAESETELVANAHSVGDLFYIGETLYKVIADLNAGDAINVGVNVEEVNVNDILDDYATKEDVQDNVSIVEKSASGAIATFDDGADDIPLKSLVVDINPIQDLHGQDAPYPAGGGKNLFDYDNQGVVLQNLSLSDRTFTNTGTDTRDYFAFDVSAYNGSTLIPNTASTSTVRETGRKQLGITINSECTKIRIRHSGGSVNFNLDFPWTRQGTFTISVDVLGYNASVVGGLSFKDVVIADGDVTVTTYAPYSNICPISGWTGMNVQQTGKNLFDDANATIYPRYFRLASSKTNIWELDSNSTSFVFRCKPNTTYTVSCDNENITIFRIGWIAENPDALTGNPVINDTIRKTASGASTITTGANAKAIVIQLNRTVGIAKTSKMQIELGSTATEYEPYNGTTIPISWQTEAGTVYGGKLDVLSGELVVDRATVILDGSNDEVWTLQSINSYGIANFYTYVDHYPAQNYKTFCDIFPPQTSLIGATETEGYFFHHNGSTVYIRIYSHRASTSAEMREWLASNPIHFVFGLAEPITYHLTSTEVRTLLGINNIFADTGDTSVEYFSQVDEDLVDYIKANLNSYAKKDLLNNYVDDIQIDGTSIVENGIAEIPFATSNTGGVVKVDSSLGIKLNDTNKLLINRATTTQAKAGSDAARPIVPICQHESVFYGLTKAAGVDMASSSNAVGIYTDEAKTAIKQMLGIHDTIDSFVEEVSGTDVTITGQPSYRYNCGELYSLTVTPPSSGTIDIRFTSGSTPTVLTLPQTVKMPEWWVEVETNTIYEICITDGIYCGVMSWAV